MKTYHVDFFVNGEEYELDVPANKTALNVIRDMLDLTGAKEGCGAGECGACAMIVDGVLINGCLMLDRPRHETSIKPEEIAINVVYEDDQLMVVNKEAGMVVHPGY